MVLNKNNSLYLRIQYINFSKKLIESFISKRIKKGNKNRSFSSFFKLLRLLQVFGKISNNLNYFFEKKRNFSLFKFFIPYVVTSI